MGVRYAQELCIACTIPADVMANHGNTASATAGSERGVGGMGLGKGRGGGGDMQVPQQGTQACILLRT